MFKYLLGRLNEKNTALDLFNTVPEMNATTVLVLTSTIQGRLEHASKKSRKECTVGVKRT